MIVISDEEVRSIIKGLYSCSIETQLSTLESFYGTSSAFDDPLTLCHQRLDIIKQFNLLARACSSISVDIKSITITSPTMLNESATYLVYVDQTQRYKLLSLLPEFKVYIPIKNVGR